MKTVAKTVASTFQSMFYSPLATMRTMSIIRFT